MKTNPGHRMLAASRTVYGWLLQAYPPTHRAEYGPAMAQLFRDQSDDAWTESGGWGLLKLWLRVVPDLIKTSIVERFAALSERKSMPDKIASLVQPRTVFLRIFMAVFLLSVTLSVIITNILPETYASTATVRLENDQPSKNYDPYFIQTQFEVIQSPSVLNRVIDRLKLNVQWGKKYFAGETLKSTETMEILKGRLSLRPIGNSALVGITCYSDDRVEAASIANGIATAYRDYREESRIESGSAMPQRALVQITDRAEPGIKPVRPNKTTDVVMGAIWGIVLASVIGGVSVLVVLGLRKRRTSKMTAG
ncbi:MAG TPA: hypothetical protein VG347_18655 [Verrucomicrobiae bacterium]|nr:hypothetical protein [Verrucomicrobiae bacterium]